MTPVSASSCSDVQSLVNKEPLLQESSQKDDNSIKMCTDGDKEHEPSEQNLTDVLLGHGYFTLYLALIVLNNSSIIL